MAPAAVVEPLDVVEDVRPGLRPGAIPTPVHAFAFQQAKETLRHGVIVTTAHGAHAAHDAVSGEELLILLHGGALLSGGNRAIRGTISTRALTVVLAAALAPPEAARMRAVRSDVSTLGTF